MIKFPDLPNVPTTVDDETREFLEAVRNILEMAITNRGGEESKFVTIEMLQNLGFDTEVTKTVEPQYDFSSLL